MGGESHRWRELFAFTAKKGGDDMEKKQNTINLISKRGLVQAFLFMVGILFVGWLIVSAISLAGEDTQSFISNHIDAIIIGGVILIFLVSQLLRFRKYLVVIIPIVIGIIVMAWVVQGIFSGFGNLGKYEGQNAKEWYYDYADVEDRYQKFRDCVEEYDNFDIRTKLEYGGVFYYCE